MHYLDHAATSPLRPEAADAVRAQWASVGNPSSLHAFGRRARRVVEESRETIAAHLRVEPADVVFTAGGTEADNLAVKGIAGARRPGGRILVSAVEHHAVLDAAEAMRAAGFTVQRIPVDGLGRLDLAALEALLADDVALVSVMWANNEVGTLQPVAQIADMCRARGVPVHTDAVQALALGELDLSIVTAASVSAHKIGGPVGVGALVLDRGIDVAPLLHGGGQERGVRSGTLDAAGVAGFAAAATAPHVDVTPLRDSLIAGVLNRVPDTVLNGDPIDRLPNNAHFTFPGCPADVLLMVLDAAGVAVSTGSACTAGIPEPSHVLLAMGADDATASSALRFTFGWNSTAEDVQAVLDVLPTAVNRARRAGGGS